MGLQRIRYRPRTHRLGARPRPGRRSETSALLSRSHRLAPGAGCHSAEAQLIPRGGSAEAAAHSSTHSPQPATFTFRTGSLSDVYLSPVPIFPPEPQSHRFHGGRFHRSGRHTHLGLIRERPSAKGPPTGKDRLVHGPPLHLARRASACTPSAISDSHAECFGRFQPHLAGRHAAALPSRESAACAAPIL